VEINTPDSPMLSIEQSCAHGSHRRTIFCVLLELLLLAQWH